MNEMELQEEFEVLHRSTCKGLRLERIELTHQAATTAVSLVIPELGRRCVGVEVVLRTDRGELVFALEVGWMGVPIKWTTERDVQVSLRGQEGRIGHMAG